MYNSGQFEKGHKRKVKGFNDFNIVGNIVEIFIKDSIVLIDKEDLETVRPFRWHLDSHGYAVGENHLTKVKVVLSRLIILCPEDKLADHKNLNILDNRKENLRIADKMQNAYNSKKRTGCNSKFKGVSFRKDRDKWRAYITADKNTKQLGTFDSEIEAAKAYNEAAIILHGEFAKLNEIIIEIPESTDSK